jgi:hypothetical protein
MSIPCLVFARLLIPQYHVSYCRFWMPIQTIIKSASTLMKKKNNVHHPIWNLLLYKDGIRPQEWGSHILEGNSHHLDDVVVKSKKRGEMLDDLKETFDNLYKYKMMLNPKKMCVRCIIR